MNAEPQTLRIRYDADELDVRHVARSLLGLADAFDLAHGAVGGGYAHPPSLRLVESRPTGEVVLALEPPEEGLHLARDGETSGIAGPACALAAIRWSLLRGRLGDEAEAVRGDDGVAVRWDDGTRLDVPTGAEELTRSRDFNAAVGQAFAPLRDERVRRITLAELTGPTAAISERDEQDQHGGLEVAHDDLRSFNVAEPEDDLVSDNVRTVAVRLVNLAFKENNKWKVDDGTSVFWASLHDLGFLQRVNSSEEVFARDDILKVRLRDQQYRAAHGTFRVEHHIEEVLEHRRAVPPDELPFELGEVEPA